MLKRFTRGLIPILAAIVLLLAVTVPAFAATTADVTVTATPSYVSISNAPSSKAYGIVAASEVYNTTQGYFTITNGSSVTTKITIATTGANWTGGIGWVVSATGTAGEDTAGLMASNNTGAFDIIVKNAAPNYIYENLASGVNPTWELQLKAPTAFNDGAAKSVTVRLTSSTA